MDNGCVGPKRTILVSNATASMLFSRSVGTSNPKFFGDIGRRRRGYRLANRQIGSVNASAKLTFDPDLPIGDGQVAPAIAAGVTYKPLEMANVVKVLKDWEAADEARTTRVLI